MKKKKKERIEKLISGITDVQWHRNGICGLGFHVVRFISDGDNGDPRPFVAVVFNRAEHYEIAVLDTTDLTQCWRGDNFRDEVVAAIDVYESRKADEWSQLMRFTTEKKTAAEPLFYTRKERV